MCPGCVSNLAMAVMSIGLTSSGGIAALVWKRSSSDCEPKTFTTQESSEIENEKEQSPWQQAR